MRTLALLIKAACFTFVSLAASQVNGQVVRYGNCAIDLELAELPDCAVSTTDGRLYVRREFTHDVFSRRVSGIVANPISVSGKKLASTMIPHGGWAYFDPTGLVVVRNVATFDNGADTFHRGLVPVTKGNKWGLADANGRLVVPMRYDGLRYAEPKSGWIACTGCRKEVAGEHWWFAGGSWIRLNTRGRVVGRLPDPALIPKGK